MSDPFSDPPQNKVRCVFYMYMDVADVLGYPTFARHPWLPDLIMSLTHLI